MMVNYGFFHQDKVNLITHFIGVPIILASTILPLTWLSFAGSGSLLNAGLVAVLAIAIYYISLDRKLGLISVPFLLLLWYVASLVGSTGYLPAGWYALAGFFGGYALQFAGHAYEGKKPALMAFNPIIAMLTAPLFIVTEVIGLFGGMPELFARVNGRIRAMEQA